MTKARKQVKVDIFHKKFTLQTLFIGIILLYSIMPIVSWVTSATLTSYFYMVIVVLLFLLLIFDRNGQNFWKAMAIKVIVLLPFIVYIGFTYLNRTSSLLLWGYQSLLFIIPVLIGLYLKDRKEDFSKLLIFAFFVTIVTTCIGCFRHPYIARYSATGLAEYTTICGQQNIGGYEFVYHCVLLYPYVIICYKRGKIRLWTALLASLLIFVTCIISDYAIAFVFALVISLLYFVKKDAMTKTMLIDLLVLAVVVLILWNILPSILTFIANHIPSSTISERLLALAGGKSSLLDFEDDRIARYQLSWNYFIQYPFFGKAIYGIRDNGGHSFVLDWLADFGLVGAAILLWMYFTVYMTFYHPHHKEKGFGFLLVTFFAPVLLSFVNTGMWLEVLCFYGPILYKGISLKECKKGEGNLKRREYGYSLCL